MEHLPPVTNPHDPIFVPYIGDRVYDGLGFAGYPARRGFDIDGLLKGDFKEASSDQVASFLQTWLYFGMMHEILGVTVKTADFVRTDEYGKKWLTTNKLPGVLHKVRLLVDREKTLPEYTPEYVERRNNGIAKCLRLALDIWEGFSALKERYSVPNPMSPEVSIAIQILGITLQVGSTEICGGAPGEDSYRDVPWEHVRHFRLTHNASIEERMISQGWCPAMIEHIRSQFHVVGLYYASLLGPPRRTLDHGNCSMDLKYCRAMKGLQVGEVTHVVDGCQCELVCVDKFKLANIIRENKIPVLRFSKRNGKPTLEAVSSTSEPGLEYTAISHVWSDGWGNPEKNSLRLCRIEKIVGMISASYTIPDFHVEPPQGKHYRATKHDDRVFFWMDTLCVPREPADIYEKAIISMRDVYKQAERVLVLDSELMASTVDASYEELNMRIHSSWWIRRLWTIQEAVLAKRLVFQFTDGAYIFTTGSLSWQARKQDLGLNYFNSIGWDCLLGFDAYDSFNGSAFIRYIWIILLSGRSVTVEADEPICGAILMNFDMNKLMEASKLKSAPLEEDKLKAVKQARMREFWRLHGDRVPLGVLYIPGPRLNDQGFSWAPASFLACQSAGVGFDNTGTVTDEGLRLKRGPYTSFTLTTPAQLKESIFPCNLDGNRYFIKKSPVKTSPSWDNLDLHKQHGLAVLLETRIVQGEDRRLSIKGQASRGALVSIVRGMADGGEVFFAKYLALVSAIQEGSSYHRFPKSPWSAGEIEQGARGPCEAECIQNEQEWCLV